MLDLTTTEVVIVEDETNLSLSFVIAGDPPVQQRPRMNCKKAVKSVPIYYDPSSLKKKAWKKSVVKALVDYGVKSFPLFKEKHTDIMQSDGLSIDVLFYVRRRRSDYRSKKGILYLKDVVQKYPGKKDTDNMLKFVMDALHEVLYDDDKCIVKICASKKFVDEDKKEVGGYTALRITSL